MALQRASRQDEFVPLMVRLRQLTDLLKQGLPAVDAIEVTDSGEPVELPPITGSKSYTTIPKVQFDDEKMIV